MALPERKLGTEGFSGTAEVYLQMDPLENEEEGRIPVGQQPVPTPPQRVVQGYGAMSLTEFAAPVIAPNAEATLRHVLESGVTVINTAGVLSLMCCMMVFL